ncbi:MAG TPA: CsgG/HfaB family protein [Opitutaceae bacterium]|nr:CsgG/HfaB family protein [Opitutaceae bacterium]
MKLRIWPLLLASLAVVSFVSAADSKSAAPISSGDSAKGGLRFTIGVTKFENKSNFSGQFALADTWGSLLTDSLVQSGRFIVLGESDMRAAALQEQDLASTGRTAGGDKTPVTGNLSPAQLLVKGEITHFQASTTGGDAGVRIKGFRIGGGGDTAEINVVIYVVDSTTGQVVASKKVVGSAKSGGLTVGFTDRNWGADLGGFKKTNVGKAVEAAIDDAVKFITGQVKDLPWTGSVILVKGDKVWINRGSREGVTAGQAFRVGTSEILRDPGTGETLDVSFTKKGDIKVDSAREKVSICSIVSGEGIQKGMAVSLPE